jgi:hypothetical protein
MSVSLHFHDGELQKLVEYCVNAYVASIQAAYQNGVKSFTTNGSCEKSEQRYLRAEQKLIDFTMNLTPDQRSKIDLCFER